MPPKRLLNFVAVLGFSFASVNAQTAGATFGDVIKLGATPSDVVLDESRGRLYLVNSAANRVDVYSYTQNMLLGSIKVGTLPFAAAMSMDSSRLYVTNNSSSTLSVIDLGGGIGNLSASIALPAKPEGVEVGNDGRVLISTQGTGTNTATPQNVLLIYDPLQGSGAQIQPVNFPPTPTTPATLATFTTARPTTTFRGKLIRTPDGRLIVGVNNINAAASQTLVYVYEVASGTVLRTRASVGQSTALSMSPDGSRFMAGFTMFDTATLAVMAQMSNLNAPFTLGAFNTTANFGGSIFSPDGTAMYAAYNTASGNPLPKPSASTLLISNPNNLAIKMGIKVPESIVAKLVSTADGANAWASSESGLVHLPLSTLYDYPILIPDQTAVFLAQDDCNRGIASTPIKITNIGKGKLTFSVPATGTALAASVDTGVAPATMTLTMDPGRTAALLRQPGTNLYAGGTGNAFTVNLASPEAINIPPTILVYMNYRQSDQRGQVVPIAVSPNGTNSQGLKDMVYDDKRGRIYISNAGKNQIEVFDTTNQQLLNPLPAGQFPGALAMGTDGDTLYVANTGGESIQLIDLNSGTTAGNIVFPPIPRAATATTVYSVLAMANGLSGLQIIMSNGTQWQVIGNTAVPRQVSSVINSSLNNTSSAQAGLSANGLTMVSTPDYTQALLLAGNYVYLYDALSDSYIGSRQLYSAGVQSYYGPMAAAPGGAYYMVNGFILNSALVTLGGTISPMVTPTSTSVSVTTNRNIAALAAVNDHQFLRLTTPVRASSTSTGNDDSRTTLYLIDLATNTESSVGPMPENPILSDFGSTPNRVNIPGRQMVVDSQGTAYIVTISGLTVVPLTTGSNTTPTFNNQQPIVNSTDGGTILRPGAFITINGQALASAAAPTGLTAPTRLGGTCVTLSDIAIPLLRTTPNQISAQLPPDLRPGLYVAQVRSLANAQQSTPVVVTVAAAQQ